MRFLSSLRHTIAARTRRLKPGLLMSVALAVFLVISMTSASNTNAAEPDDPRRPGAIDTENVPVVPAEIFDKLRQFARRRSAAG
jgi:hypothetical protein